VKLLIARPRVDSYSAREYRAIHRSLDVNDSAPQRLRQSSRSIVDVELEKDARDKVKKVVDRLFERFRFKFNDDDKFYRYTTGRFSTREEAYALRRELIRKGYPDEIFIKKVSKN